MINIYNNCANYNYKLKNLIIFTYDLDLKFLYTELKKLRYKLTGELILIVDEKMVISKMCVSGKDVNYSNEQEFIDYCRLLFSDLVPVDVVDKQRVHVKLVNTGRFASHHSKIFLFELCSSSDQFSRFFIAISTANIVSYHWGKSAPYKNLTWVSPLYKLLPKDKVQTKRQKNKLISDQKITKLQVQILDYLAVYDNNCKDEKSKVVLDKVRELVLRVANFKNNFDVVGYEIDFVFNAPGRDFGRQLVKINEDLKLANDPESYFLVSIASSVQKISTEYLKSLNQAFSTSNLHFQWPTKQKISQILNDHFPNWPKDQVHLFNRKSIYSSENNIASLGSLEILHKNSNLYHFTLKNNNSDEKVRIPHLKCYFRVQKTKNESQNESETTHEIGSIERFMLTSRNFYQFSNNFDFGVMIKFKRDRPQIDFAVRRYCGRDEFFEHD